MKIKRKTIGIILISILFLLAVGIIIQTILAYMIDNYYNKTIGSMCYDDCKGESGIVEGVVGNGFKFNDSTTIEIYNKNLDVLGSDSFRIDLWFKNDKNTIGDLISKGSSKENWFTFTQRNNRHDYQMWIQLDDGNQNKEIIGYNSFNDDEWHYAILDFKRINNTGWLIFFVIDGKLERASYLENYGLLNNTEPLLIGSACKMDKLNANKYGCFEYWGSIDELKIYHKNELILEENFERRYEKE